MTAPLWKNHPLSRERAEDMGLSGEPECGGCAEYIYCGTGFSAHAAGCPFAGPALVMEVSGPPLDLAGRATDAR